MGEPGCLAARLLVCGLSLLIAKISLSPSKKAKSHQRQHKKYATHDEPASTGKWSSELVQNITTDPANQQSQTVQGADAENQKATASGSMRRAVLVGIVHENQF
jgi:hypothetical protein